MKEFLLSALKCKLQISFNFLREMFNIYIYNEIILINDESFDIAEAGNSNYFSQHTIIILQADKGIYYFW